MALSASAIIELNASATANNVNGGGFNPTNANFLTDLTTDSNTANTASPVASSASYNFVAGDVSAWLYIQSGTNWTPGWYKIASVASNKATLSAAVGAAIQVDTTQGYPTPRYKANTVAGCATVGTPTGGVFTIDYSQGTAAIVTATDYTAVGGSTTLTSVTGGFTTVMKGNYYHQTTTGTGGFGTVGWYEIINVTDGNTLTLDRAPNGGTANVACTGYIGGAMSLNSTLDDDLFDTIVASSRIFMKAGSYTAGESITPANGGAAAAPTILEGYNTLRGDAPTGTSRPSIAMAANSLTFPGGWDIYNIIVTSTQTNGFNNGANSKVINCKSTQTSTTAARNAIVITGDGYLEGNETVSYRGNGVSIANSAVTIVGNYIHDSDKGIASSTTGTAHSINNNIIASCVTAAIDYTGACTAAQAILGNTLYGAENTTSIGVRIASGGTDFRLVNNILYGFTTAISHADSGNKVGYSNYNDFYNNDTDVTNFQKGASDQAVAPAFTSVAQITGATATTSGSTITQSGATFQTSGVTAGRDFLYLVSGTGVTAGIYGISSVDSETQLTLDIAPGTNATADKVWQITTGRNFAIGTALRGLGFPAAFPAALTTSYPDIGAVQRQETDVIGGVRHPGMAGGLNA